MIKILWSVMRAIRDKIHSVRDPVGFARSIGVRVGNNVRFYGMSRAMFGSEPWLISIGDNVYITAGIQFVTHDGGTLILRGKAPDLEWTAPIEVGSNVYIGIRTTILPGVRIGNWCVIGAGSVVTRDIPPNSVYAGVPAKFICSTDTYFEKLKTKSLGFGHLPPEEKAIAIRRYYQERGWFDSRDSDKS